MTQRLDDLIRDLSADLRPVRRLAPPLWRAALWLGVVVAGGFALASVADLPALMRRLAVAPDMALAMAGSAVTTALAAVAAFQLSMPDRKPGWALLPLPGLVLWVAGTGLGCLRGWIVPETHVAAMGEARDCFAFIVGLSIPLSALMLLMIRRACPLRPALTAVVGGLAVAAGAATLLGFFHPYDAGATDLVVHAVAIALVIGANRLCARRWLAGPGTA